jgi:hypothetical protein
MQNDGNGGRPARPFFTRLHFAAYIAVNHNLVEPGPSSLSFGGLAAA